ncbi:MAG TPA: hypothetical protein VN577_19270 [Terriglobales bacterium]|nr:hypothetical protein [Terriglobales bacterium]
MTSSFTRPKPLSAKEVREIVRDALEKGVYRETSHAKFDHAERMIGIQDVLYGLETDWRSCTPDEFNPVEWQWKYRIRTRDIDGENLTIIVAVDPRSRRFEVITRFHE